MLRNEIAAFDQEVRGSLRESSRQAKERKILPRDHWTQGERTARAFRDAIRIHGTASPRFSTRRADGRPRTVVDADGWVMTAAGTLPAEPKVSASDAQVLAAQV